MPLYKSLPPPDRVFPFHHRLVPVPAPERKSATPSVPALPSDAVEEGRASALGDQQRCTMVRQVTEEMVMLVTERVPLRRDRRRITCHVQQISMYVCHVILQISMTDVARAFGRNRSTVSHACQTVEDRRDDPAYDDFVCAVERVATVLSGTPGGSVHG